MRHGRAYGREGAGSQACGLTGIRKFRIFTVVAAQFEWDDAKAASNLAKHGISFASATAVFSDPKYVIFPTVRAMDQEDRLKAIGRIEHRLYTVVYVEREGRIRLISARRANDQEAKRYGDDPLFT